jgi:hypothetical protein
MTFATLREWVDVGVIKALSLHTSGIIASLIFFAVVGKVVTWAVTDECTRHIVELMEGATLVAQFAWLIYQMAVVLWNKRVKFNACVFAMVA